MKTQLVLFAATLAAIFTIGSSLKCLECNVWKAGYGHLCDNPRIREDCLVCMKTETTIFIGYYKSVPRSSTIISRVCAKTKTVHFSDECHHFTMSDGNTKRCYCNSDLCNSARKWTVPSLTMLTVITLLGYLMQKLS